jgi:hypothetical protein
MIGVRKETDSLGEIDVAADKLWGAQTQRSLEHFNIGSDLIPREMITSYAILKKAAAIANHAGKRLAGEPFELIVKACDEILGGLHHESRRVSVPPMLPAPMIPILMAASVAQLFPTRSVVGKTQHAMSVWGAFSVWIFVPRKASVVVVRFGRHQAESRMSREDTHVPDD